MPRVMVFIDGTWLYCNAPRLSESQGRTDFRVDFGKLPKIVAARVAEQLGVDLDLVRVHLYGSYAVNHDHRDDEAVRRRRDFFSLVREEFRYDVETYPINFMGRSVRRSDREPGDDFEPRESVVDVALAAGLVYWGASDACDVAVVLSGTPDVRPAMKKVRKMGKRVALVSIRDACSPVIADPRNDTGYVDCDTLWLDDMLADLELQYTEHMLVCASEDCRKEVWTTFHPRRGQRFYCDECREEFARQRREAVIENNATGGNPGDALVGTVRRKITDRGYGFIEIEDGRQYFFHLSDLDDVTFDDLQEGEEVEFEVKRVPANGQAGAAQLVRTLERLT